MPESSRQTDASLSRALAACRAVLGHRPAGLLTDFDGTLSPIVADPEAARLADGAAPALAALATRLEVVAVVTGRAALGLRRLSGLHDVLVVGAHGAEWLEPGDSMPTAVLDADAVASALDRAVARLPAIHGVNVEHKGLAATVHYRHAADPAATRAEILAALGDLRPEGIAVSEGRMHVELRPTDAPTKGTAARAIVERYGLRGVVALGDDVTDLDMFAAIADLRAAGAVEAAIVAVGSTDGEVPASVLHAADAVVESPGEVVALLRELAVSG